MVPNVFEPLKFYYNIYIYINLRNFLLTSLCVFSVLFSVSSDSRLDSSTSLSAAALSVSALAYFVRFEVVHS